MDKLIVWQKRKEFYEAIIENLFRPPNKIDIIMNQAEYYIQPSLSDVFFLEGSGDFAIRISGNFCETDFEFWYSIWQYGDVLKIAILLNDSNIYGAVIEDSCEEVKHIWGNGIEPRLDVSHGGVLYEWEFEVPNLYDSYLAQEKFILGFRHMHFRILRMVYEYCSSLGVKDI